MKRPLLPAAFIVMVIGASFFSKVHASDDVRVNYHQSVAATYDYRFGKEMPFLPSNATTADGDFIPAKAFPSAKYCGHCHQEAHKEWRQSAHANSFRAPWYTKNVNLLSEEKGVEFTRHCEGCHNPIALLSGSLTKGSKLDRGFDEDGVTCSVCHSIQKVDTRGTGSYVMARPAALVDEAGKPIYGEPTDNEIMFHLDRHSRAVMQPFYRTSEFCASCHKAALPKQLNDYKWQRAFTVYDEWQMSSFAKQSPLPFYVKDQVSTCQTCHMPRETLTTVDYGSKSNKLASHRWVGANTLLPQYYSYPEQLKKTSDFLKNNVFNIDLFSIETNDGAPIMPLGIAPLALNKGDKVVVSVVIQNKGIAHSHVPEQRDMYESWVEFEVKDSRGRELFHSGSLSEKGDLDPKAHSFTNRLINNGSTLNDLHQVWKSRVVAYNNTIASGRSQLVRYAFRVPADAKGTIRITAKVNYRRFDQHFIDFGMGKHYVMPVVTMVERTHSFRIGHSESIEDFADNALWMRWNNYGIALLDAQQYEASVKAFQKVADLRPTYADAYTNIALANFQWQRYDESRSQLEKALALSPGNARALYYLALVRRNQGDLQGAIDSLKKVIAQYPRSRDALRELGFSYYQLRQYALARGEYESLQQIDPDDLAAHYILSVLYSRLGEKQKAAQEAAIFADQKDDPTASSYALEFLRNHTEIAAESIVWHTHGDAEPVSKSRGGR
jgi:tetratricopeptide (TPR) repeat protein